MPARRPTKAEIRRTIAHLKTEERSQPFNLEVKYPAEKFPVFDNLISKAVGRGAHSVSIDVGTPKKGKPKRDLAFSFATQKALDNAVKRVKKLKVKLPSITLRAWED
jgi:hypothetical protein